jgi:hypothetical protein
MYPFFPLNLNLVKCLQNKKKKPKKTTKKKKKNLLTKLMQATKGKELMKTSNQTYASNKRQGAYEDFFGIHTCKKFNMLN